MITRYLVAVTSTAMSDAQLQKYCFFYVLPGFLFFMQFLCSICAYILQSCFFLMEEIFVPGRLCLLGEHSDWAGGYRTVNPSLPKGVRDVCCLCVMCADVNGMFTVLLL